MKISLNWVKDYVLPGVLVDRLVRRMTMAGIEAEKIQKLGKDTVIEFEITPNRPDCLNMVGIAREIAAVLNKPLTLPKISKRKFPVKKCDVVIEAADGCSRYIATVVEGVNVRTAPDFIRKRIKAVGNRPISNVVDATNFCLFELGQPMHAFDLDKLKGKRIIVRYARKGERIVTLDGVERELDPSVLVIADAERPVALAGIMGGANTEVTAQTKNILIESAYFDPVLIRRTARKFGLSSDSSYRFERGVVFETVKTAADRALDLILVSAGGTVTARADVVVSNPIRRLRPVTLDLRKMNAFLGAEVSAAVAKRILKALGFGCTAVKKDVWKIIPPFFRADIQRPEDLYEEVARVVGYENLPSSFPSVKLTGMVSSVHRAKRLKVTDLLLSQGFNEVVTYSLLSREQVKNAEVEDCSSVTVLNALSIEQEFLRPHLLPSLLQVAHTNINRGQKDLAVFEVGKVYPKGGEREMLGLLLTGCLRRDWRRPQFQPFDFYDIKGAVERTLSQAGLGPVSFAVSREKCLEDGQRADVFVGRKKVGCCGKVSDEAVSRFGIRQAEVFFAQLDLEDIYGFPAKKISYTSVAEFPGIMRDVSLAVAQEATFEEVVSIVREFGSAYLKQIDFKEVYLGDKIPQGQRGLVFSVLYQSCQRTLTEEEIQEVHDQVCQKLVERLGATLR